jgi:hypothetical protein
VTDPDLVQLFVAPLERAGITYMVTGGVASVVYGDPRFTRDVDLVVELDAASVGTLVNAFEGGSFYLPPEEALLEEVGRTGGGHFKVIDGSTALRADVYLAGDDPFHAWALERRRRIEVEGLAIWLAPLEYVIVRKLEYFRASGSDRHLRDVAMMLRISGSLVNHAALGEWSDRHEVADLLEEARAFGHD